MNKLKITVIGILLLAIPILYHQAQDETRTEVFRGTVFDVKGRVVTITWTNKTGLKQGLQVNYQIAGDHGSWFDE